MDRHIAKVTAFATGASLIAGTYAFAAVGGMSWLGLGSTAGLHKIAAEAGVAPGTTNAVDVTAAATSPLTNAPLAPISVAVPSNSTSRAGASQPQALTTPAASPQPGAPTAVNAPQPEAPAPVIVIPIITAAPPTAAPAIIPKTVPVTPAPTTAAPTTAAPTTAAPKVTPTTVARPPGVPSDWPAGKPIPPMPAVCSQPQLELSGVWNCGD